MSSEERQDIERLVQDPRTQFALDLLDPRRHNDVLLVPKEFQVLSNQSVDERNFWGCVDAHLTIALGVHHGVCTKHIVDAVTTGARIPEKEDYSLAQFLEMLGAKPSEVRRLLGVIRSNKTALADSRVPAAPVLSIRSQPLKIISSTMPIRSYLAAVDTNIYYMALSHLRSTFDAIARIRRFGFRASLSAYSVDIFLEDPRWGQLCQWVRASVPLETNVKYLANPLPAFFGSVVHQLRSWLELYPVDALDLPFFKEHIWEADLSYGQTAVVLVDAEEETRVLKEGKTKQLTFPWANSELACLRAGYASRRA